MGKLLLDLRIASRSLFQHRRRTLFLGLAIAGVTALLVLLNALSSGIRETMIRTADHIIDLGPGAGRAGGEVVYQGDLKGLMASGRSQTAEYLSGRKRIEVPAERVKPGSTQTITIQTAARRDVHVTLAAVDEGILQFAGYRTPDPIAFFFQKRALEVRTEQIMDLILPEFSVVRSLQAMGGGGGYDDESFACKGRRRCCGLGTLRTCCRRFRISRY